MRRLLLACCFASGCAATPTARPATPPTSEVARNGYSTLAERVLPSVVLLVRRDLDGALYFGAGFLIEHGPPGSAHVLTADHVVSGPGTLRALFYDRTRTSYTPMDGGLDRFLFENQDALRPATVLEHDPVGDLALVAIEPDPRISAPAAPRLRLAERAPRIGDEVLALGHPQETVWSFTRGVVSGLHRDMIQHDAVSSGGSSGGPLIALDGSVVGVNTAKIANAVRGLGFARPVARARALLVGTAARLDRTTPEVAVRTCWHAQEVGSPMLAECFDWPDAWRDVQRAVDRLAASLPDDARRVRADLEVRGGYTGFVERNRSHIVAEYHQGVPISPMGKTALTGERRAFGLSLAAHRSADEVRAAAILRERNGAHVELHDAVAFRKVMRKGLRIDEVRLLEPRAAWIRLGGRNPDGSALSFSEYWVSTSDGWRQRLTVHDDERRRLPTGWPPPLDDENLQLHGLVEQLLERAEYLAHPAPESTGGPKVAPR